MLAELTRQDQIANDLANASTPGYKPDRTSQQAFAELFLHDRSSGAPVGLLGLGSTIAEIRTDYTQGPLLETVEPLDVALEGDGFLVVQTQAGTRYTRNGQLTLDGEGRLRTATGYLVLDDSGQAITLGNGKITIATDGKISVGGTAVATLGVVSLSAPVKEGENLFTGQAGAKPESTTVRQGYLEGSGVSPATAMVDMIVSLRAFESLQRVLHAIDETFGRAINGGMG